MTDDSATDHRTALLARLAALGIEASTVPYPAHRTVEEGKALRGNMAGQFTKNLLLKDKKGSLFMIVAGEDRPIDLRRLHVHIGAQGRLGFASAETMREVLQVEPGALTPFSLMHDRTIRVKPVIDAGLMQAAQLNFHPLVNTESTGIRPDALFAFIVSCGHAPLVADFGAMALADPDA